MPPKTRRDARDRNGRASGVRAAVAVCLLILVVGRLTPPAMGAGDRYRAWVGALISEWEKTGTHERGADATDLELAGLRLFVTYDEVIERLEGSGFPYEISAMRRVPCVYDRIDRDLADAATGAGCMDYVEVTLGLGSGERDHLKASFAEDVYDAPGTSMIIGIEYTKDYGEKAVELDDAYAEIAHKYGHEPEHPHLRYYLGHFAKLDSYPYVEPEWRLPYLRMYLGSVSPITRYSLVLSAGSALRADLEAEADRLVQEATPVPEFRLPWGM